MAYLNGKKISLNPKFLGISDLTQLYKYLGDKVEKKDGTPANIEDVISLIKEINNVGVKNLENKNITVMPGFSQTEGELPITTAQIMSAIEEIPQSVSLDYTVTFTVEGEPYEVVSVKDGNSINAPATNPQGETTRFDSWDDNNNIPVNFPYQPTGDVVLYANMIESVVAGLYSFYGVNKNDYPVLIVDCCYNYWLKIYFAESVTRNNNVAQLSGSILTSEKISYKFTSDPGNNFGLVAITCKQKATSVTPVSYDEVIFGLQADQRTYSNVSLGVADTPVYLVD